MKRYTSPIIQLFILQMEESIASASALTSPSSSNVNTEWETGQDVSNSFSWE
ncbi:hypothetical protein [Sphingobacterium bovistauri]|uniref:Uncharacterized protein n=1 Tax=Sphingobacterium bovistauri TaxID=2781959 RepID=A0ABS7Z8T0_9SPHI|nr:hypothetical protein [Sphingobacterium bovistauri]MCA5006607.1 hypothetical protein [Sphingobacterium bovistauri]